MVKKFIYWRVRVKLRVNRGIVEMFWWEKKLQNSALLMLIDSEPTPPNTHTHTKIIISLSFYHFPLLVISLCHLGGTLCREAQIWKHQIQRVWTESSACFFYIYASNVNYQWTAEGQNLLSLQLWHIWIWTTIHINAVLNALCVCILPEKTFEATTSWTNRHNLVAASVPVQNTLLHLFWPER